MAASDLSVPLCPSVRHGAMPVSGGPTAPTLALHPVWCSGGKVKSLGFGSVSGSVQPLVPTFPQRGRWVVPSAEQRGECWSPQGFPPAVGHPRTVVLAPKPSLVLDLLSQVSPVPLLQPLYSGFLLCPTSLPDSKRMTGAQGSFCLVSLAGSVQLLAPQFQ